MFRHFLRVTALAFLTLFMAAPAAAQLRADIGPLHIRIATDAPPRGRYERRPARPSRQSIWVGGYWDRQQDRWSWIDGRWDQPRSPRSRWIQARYSREGCSWFNRRNCAWRYEPAHWSDQQLVEGEDYQRWRNDRSRSHRDRRHN